MLPVSVCLHVKLKCCCNFTRHVCLFVQINSSTLSWKCQVSSECLHLLLSLFQYSGQLMALDCLLCVQIQALGSMGKSLLQARLPGSRQYSDMCTVCTVDCMLTKL